MLAQICLELGLQLKSLPIVVCFPLFGAKTQLASPVTSAQLEVYLALVVLQV